MVYLTLLRGRSLWALLQLTTRGQWRSLLMSSVLTYSDTHLCFSCPCILQETSSDCRHPRPNKMSWNIFCSNHLMLLFSRIPFGSPPHIHEAEQQQCWLHRAENFCGEVQVHVAGQVVQRCGADREADCSPLSMLRTLFMWTNNVSSVGTGSRQLSPLWTPPTPLLSFSLPHPKSHFSTYRSVTTQGCMDVAACCS